MVIPNSSYTVHITFTCIKQRSLHLRSSKYNWHILKYYLVYFIAIIYVNDKKRKWNMLVIQPLKNKFILMSRFVTPKSISSKFLTFILKRQSL